jgi:NAD(P)-dependent dehydrogenase (short-subunit alcohol dehydrogenase family)
VEPTRLFGLEGRVAVVTGAVGGIGRWLSAGLAKAGAAVILTDNEPATGEEMAGALRDAGLSAVWLAVDLREDEAAQRIVEFAQEEFGRLDVLVNNAGVNRRVPMLETTGEDLDAVWLIDYRRCYELSKAAARVMVAQGRGSIVNISSLTSAFGLEDTSLYGPTKAALSQLTKTMTVEFARFGVRTNAIAPGFMATPMNASHWEHPTRAPWILGRTPMCRPGHPAELVGVCILLASDAGSFLSGQTIFVDGGFTAGSRWSVGPLEGLETYRRRLADGTLYSVLGAQARGEDHDATRG